MPPPRPREIDSYERALAYLSGRINVERTRLKSLDPTIFKLDRMRALLGELGDPHKQIRTVHVAGSKGKGSTCEMIASCLQGCGLTVGLYTSPHLVEVRERIQINHSLIEPGQFAAKIAQAAAAAAKIEKRFGEVTFFEVMTAAGFRHFADQAVDIAVIEVGLGGRLDSTNVILPEVSAVTAIQLEHAAILGDTVEKIAREKAGIFKPDVPAITYPQSSPTIIDVFRDVAGEVGAKLAVVGQDIEFSHRFEAGQGTGPHTRVVLTTPRSSFEHFPVPLPGEHQAFNCGLALAVIDSLRERGFKLSDRGIAAGLAMTPNPGRVEMIWREPRVICDGAHNPESIGGLIKTLGTHLRFDSLVVIFGCASDKDIPGMLTRIAGGADKVIFTRSENTARAADPRDLHRRFTEISHKMSQTAPNLREAINIAARAVGRDDLICVTGSFYLAGEAKKLFAAKKNAR
jgi:dihydrofolate synthase / folylpolyglutamate synthase